MNQNPLSNLTVKQLKEAIAIRERIEALQSKLGKLVGASSGVSAAPAKAAKAAKPAKSAKPAKQASKKGKRTMSPAARAKIAASTRARWAKYRADKAAADRTPAANGPAAKTKPAKSSPAKAAAKPAAKPRKGGITPEGRAKLAAAMKARWAARKKAAAKA